MNIKCHIHFQHHIIKIIKISEKEIVLRMHSVPLAMLPTKMSNSISASTDPCGTPLVNDLHLDFKVIDFKSLSATIQPIPYLLSSPSVKHMPLQFREKDIMWDSTNCTSPGRRCEVALPLYIGSFRVCISFILQGVIFTLSDTKFTQSWSL